MNLILLEASEIAADGRATLSDGRARHIVEVLKVGAGGEVRVGRVDGPIGTARVEAVDGAEVRLVCRLEERKVPAKPSADLVLALPRPKVLKRMWSQLAALGVGTIVLTNASKVERYYFDSHALSPELVRAQLLEGLAQARDTRMPIVHVRKELKPFVEDELDGLFGDARRFVADAAYQRSPIDAVRARKGRVVIAVGPEGGWSPFERDLLERNGFVGVGLGPRTLRTDTALISLLALVHEGLRG